MKKIILVLLILYINPSFGQDNTTYNQWLNLYDEGYYLFSKGQFEDALAKFNKSIALIDKIDFSFDEEAQYYPAANYRYIGTCLYNLNQFEEAAKNFTTSFELLNNIKNVNLEFVKLVSDDIISSYESYDPKKALEFSQEILDEIGQESGKESIAYAEQLFTIFLLNNRYKNSDMAIQNLNDAFVIHTILQSTEHFHYPYIVFNLAYLYFHKGDYANALVYFDLTEKNIEYYKKEQWVNISKLNYDHALSLYKQGQFGKSEEKFKTLLDDSWTINPENIEYYLYTTNYIGLSLYYQNRIKEAELTYQNSFEHLETILGTSDPLFALQKTNYMRLLLDTDNYDKAFIIGIEVYDSLEKNKQTDCQAYVNVVNNLGLIYMYKSDFEKAEQFLNKSLTTAKYDNLSTLNQIADIESNLAYVHQKLGHYDKAKSLHERALQTKTKVFNLESPEYALALMNYATYLFETGEYFKSEEYLNQSNVILKKSVGATSLLYAKLKLNLAGFYLSARRLKESLNSYDEAIEIYSKNGLENSEIMALALEGKSNCLLALGNNDEALEIGEKSYNIIKNSLGESSIQYGGAAKNLSGIYYYLGDYEKANEYIDKAFKNYQLFYDSGHASYGDILNYVIDENVANQDYDEALKLIEDLEFNRISNYGIESYNYAMTLYKKAKILSYKKEYDYSLDLYQTTESIYKKYVEESSDTYNDLLFNYAMTLDKAGKTNEALNTYSAYYSGIKNQLKDVFTYRSETDKKKFLTKFQINMDWLSGTIFQDSEGKKSLNELGVNNQLVLKSLLLNTSKDVISNLSKSENSEIKLKIDSYNSIRFQLSDPKALNDSERVLALRKELNNLETELVKLYNQNFNNSTNTNFDRNWIEIKQNLKDKELAIEFLEFETRESDYLTNERAYGAFLISANSDKPIAVKLFKAKDLKAILKNQNPNTLYQTRGSEAKSTANTKGLYQLIWSPLEEHLNGIETIYYSPSGLLNQIPFAALDTQDKPILGSQFNLLQLSSTFALTENRIEPKTDNTLFIGGINYEYTPSKPKLESKDDISQLSVLKSVSGTRSLGSEWNYLPGTLKEINSIEALFSEGNRTYSSLSADKATETSFKNLSGNSPSVIHIATHGFFFENPKTKPNDVLDVSAQNIYKIAEDPLVRSGLLFSGANYAWKNGNNPYAEDDGILTALEISNLDLSNTDMVVLSACETGLGDIEGSEGVYGLQRAFKMAGVDVIVMSLWEVPDAETAEFMNLFYTNWLNGKPVREAFRTTQLKMAETYKETPEKWAAFVLFE